MIKIDLRQLPVAGKTISGEAPPEIFELGQNDPARPESPLTYHLNVQRTGNYLRLEGALESIFSFACGRCLERYQHAIRKPDYVAEIPIENLDIIDLTDTLREDTLLDLPGYPRCENGNVQPRECPAKGEFEVRDSSDPSSEDPDEPEKENVWGALDDIEINPK